MEKFLCLPIEKQNKIIDAALLSFGTNGYKKASINDIAKEAGISKAMVFHYFGTKKELYFYLLNLCANILMNEVNESFDLTVTDFFDRIKMSTDIEVLAMKKHPGILSFLNSVYLEKDNEVIADINVALMQGEGFRSKIAFDGMDTSKFKEGIDPNLILKMLAWLADGFVNRIKAGIDIDILSKEFDECLMLLKNNFYKEENL